MGQREFPTEERAQLACSLTEAAKVVAANVSMLWQAMLKNMGDKNEGRH